jgi:hypothetical protein
VLATYPNALVTTTELPDAGANLSSNPHSTMHDDARDEIVAIEAELGVAPSGSYSTVRARLDAGWQPIATASFSAASSFTITIPASTYWMVRVVVQAAVATGNEINLGARVNNDTTAGLHIHTFAEFADDAVTTTSTSGTSWLIGRVGVNTGNVIELLITRTDASSTCPFKSNGGTFHSTETNVTLGMYQGQLSASRTISSLVIFPASSTITGAYVAEGYVLP